VAFSQSHQLASMVFRMYNHPPRPPEPRASRIPIPGRDDIATELWMGGADALFGERIAPDDLHDAWVIDLAGEMPESHLTVCLHGMARVFADVEGIPAGFARLSALAASVANCLSGAPGSDQWEHPAQPPSRLYVMCQQGMNRSGLVTGLILRALGVPAEAALAAIRTRPGALSNQTYTQLIMSEGNG
jgi:hypothetical protein